MSVIPIDLAGGKILSDEVYKRIGAAILEGTLPAGVRLRDVDLAAAQLGISRTPVREAPQRLEHFGLVEIAVGRYTRVSEPTDGAPRGDRGVHRLLHGQRTADGPAALFRRRTRDPRRESGPPGGGGEQDAMTLFEASYVSKR
jgi:DNA-binding transcriptional MocR family regulator